MSKFSDWYDRRAKRKLRERSVYTLEYVWNGTPSVMTFAMHDFQVAYGLARDFKTFQHVTDLHLYRRISGTAPHELQVP